MTLTFTAQLRYGNEDDGDLHTEETEVTVRIDDEGVHLVQPTGIDDRRYWQIAEQALVELAKRERFAADARESRVTANAYRDALRLSAEKARRK